MTPHPTTPYTGPGSCTLVRTDAGAPELLTLKALRAIQLATVLLVDDRVSESIVALASPNTRIIHVGQRGGPSTPHAFIEKLILLAVREGETVVRLQGGDPLVLGRGGEAARQRQAAGIL